MAHARSSLSQPHAFVSPFCTLAFRRTARTTVPEPGVPSAFRARTAYRFSGSYYPQHATSTALAWAGGGGAGVAGASPPWWTGGNGGNGDSSNESNDDDILQTISAAVITLYQNYLRALANSPLQTKALTSAALMLIADALAQGIANDEIDHNGRRTFPKMEAPRLARFAMYGLLFAGPITHAWYALLETCVKLPPIQAAFTKVALDQIAFSPFALVVYYAFMQFTQGNGMKDVKRVMRNEFKGAMTASYKVWPVVNLVNFALVPINLRVLFASSASLVWMTFLSLSSQPA